MSLSCKIIKDFPRPFGELVKKFSDVAVADLDDSISRFAAVSHGIVPFGSKSVLGTAFTIRLPHGDNLLFRAAIRYTKPGDVVVIDAGGFEDRAVAGEVTAKYCRCQGVKGLIIDGAIRDSKILAEMEDFAVFARSVSPNGPYFNGPGEVNVPIVIGGQIVCPGDIVVADPDGIVFIDPACAEAVLEQTLQARQKDARNVSELEKTGTCHQEWVDAKLAALNCEMVDWGSSIIREQKDASR